MTFQVSDYKGNHFLDLLDNDYLFIKPTHIKDSTWLKLIGHSNSLYMCVTKAITNHTSIGKYHSRFFPKENFDYLYRLYPIKSRCYILYKCKKYNNYWNISRESLNYFITFLEFNSGVFFFYEGIT